MASPAKIADQLPDTLPEDFNEWDGESNTAVVTPSSSGLQAVPRATETATPVVQFSELSPRQSVSPDRSREALSAATAPESLDFDSFLQNKDLMNELVEKLRRRDETSESGAPAVNEAPVVPEWLQIGLQDQAIESPQFKEIFKSGIAAGSELPFAWKAKFKNLPERIERRWVVVASGGACLLLLFVTLMIWLFDSGHKSLADQAVHTSPAVARIETKPSTSPVADTPTAKQDKAPVPGKKEQTSAIHPLQNAEQKSLPVPAQGMDEQLAAPSRIARADKPENAEAAPPLPALAIAGSEGMGGSGADAGIFGGPVQPVVKAAQAKPVPIPASVASQLALQRKVPIYPQIAKAGRISGTVQLSAIISRDGTVKEVHVKDGPSALRQSAVDAVRTWRYKPYLVNNQPTDVETTISVVFTLGG